MNTPTLDTLPIDFNRGRYVQMTADYTTHSFCLGERTYLNDHVYRVDPLMLEEITTRGVGRPFLLAHCVSDPETGQIAYPAVRIPNRPSVAVLPSVSRWFTANGQDTHHLVKGCGV